MSTDLKEMLLKNLEGKSKKELVELKEKLEEYKLRQAENLGKKYVPNVKCEQFIKNVGENKSFVNLFCAANGVGKTAVCANIVANICFGTQNEYFKQPLFQKFPYLKRGRIISDPTTLKNKIVPELKKWFPSRRYDVKYDTRKDGKNYESYWTTDTGFEFDLMSNEQDAKEFESVDLGWAMFDEPSKKDIYMGTVARMRRGGIIFWGMTPLSYSAWIKEDIYDKADGENITVVAADVWSNCLDIPGTRGILAKRDIERMISQYPENEKKARIEGEFGHLLGRVHNLFTPEIHVIKPFPINYKDFSVFCALDTHPRTPDAYTIMAIDEHEQKYIIDELWLDAKDLAIASSIKAKESGLRVIRRLIDPSAMNDDKRTDEINFGQRLVDQGLQFELGSKKMMDGIRRTDEALRYEKIGDTFIKKPELFVFNTCQRTIWEFNNYVWDEYRGTNADEKDPKGRPKDKDDHFMENIHRLLLLEPKFMYYDLQSKDNDFDPNALL